MLCHKLERWDRVGSRRETQRLIQIVAGQKSTQHCKAVTFQLQIFLKSGFWFSCRVFQRLTVDIFFFSSLVALGLCCCLGFLLLWSAGATR